MSCADNKAIKMCRYAQTNYKPHFGCFSCRKVFRKTSIADFMDQSGRLRIYEQLQRFHFEPSRRRKVEKRFATSLETLLAEYDGTISSCPDCGGRMVNLGLDFRAPKRTARRAWQTIEKTYRLGHTFQSCGCWAFGAVPKNAAEFCSYLAERREEYENHLERASRRFARGQSDEARDAVEFWLGRVAQVRLEIDEF